MDPLDLFPAAGIRFVSVQHEQNAVHMADGYARITGMPAVAMFTGGPGFANAISAACVLRICASPAGFQ